MSIVGQLAQLRGTQVLTNELTPNTPASTPTPKGRIAVIDDDAVFVDLMHDLLAVASELVPSADDVDAAMRLVDSLPPHELDRQVARWYEV